MNAELMTQLAAHERSISRWVGILEYYESRKMTLLAARTRVTLAKLRAAKLDLLRQRHNTYEVTP